MVKYCLVGSHGGREYYYYPHTGYDRSYSVRYGFFQTTDRLVDSCLFETALGASKFAETGGILGSVEVREIEVK